MKNPDHKRTEETSVKPASDETHTPRGSEVPLKKQYHAPEFSAYGDIRELTQGNSFTGDTDEPSFDFLRT